MAKFRHLDEEEYDIFCDLCECEHASSVPEKVCRENAKRALKESRYGTGRKRDDDEEDDDNKF